MLQPADVVQHVADVVRHVAACYSAIPDVVKAFSSVSESAINGHCEPYRSVIRLFIRCRQHETNQPYYQSGRRQRSPTVDAGSRRVRARSLTEISQRGRQSRSLPPSRVERKLDENSPITRLPPTMATCNRAPFFAFRPKLEEILQLKHASVPSAASEKPASSADTGASGTRR